MPRPSLRLELTVSQFNTLRLPRFLGIEPRAFDRDTFQPPIVDHHTNTRSQDFSAATTSATTMRYRKGQSGKLESNTVVYKWADGSTTISVGDQHYELQSKPLAPRKDEKTYKEVQDSHSYVASPSITSQLLLLVGHLQNQYTIIPNKDVEDEALEKLQNSLLAATRKGDKGISFVPTVDPELAKKQAEAAEKERMRAQRRRENAAERATMTRSGRGIGGGLTVDDLEGRGRRAPGSGRKPAGAKRPRRRPDYDSDDDLPRGGRTREDEYDREDDFLASSDEEEEVDEGGEGDEEEEEILDDSEPERPKAKKQKTERSREPSDADADADAEADLMDEEAPAAAPTSVEASLTGTGVRGRKRHVIEDDEDE